MSVSHTVPRPVRAVLNRRGALAALALLAVSGCGGSEPSGSRATDPHWDYDAEGPDHWADLDSHYVTCRSGHAQSPIDLPGHSQLHPTDHIEIDYRPIPSAELVNNGHTIQANVPAGNRILVDGKPFALTQFHFHLPSEHTVDGADATMELHFVHADSNGRPAVLAVLLRAQEGGSPFDAVLATPPDHPGATRSIGRIDPRRFLPDDLAQFRYQGSLTTPPCTEGVEWIVLSHPVPVAVTEADRFRALFPHSNRPTQPRYGRPVILAGPR
ncbi:carbonic anhydrase family protein [Nocardia cyriacigeorgica]|uniref:carbonic anhydrase n=1 Tax=Nocardia cyriacigeorgica TaxID=135487 RepID=A0A6P1D7N4_9NOCA|nr:carbonic anhydrase family protein [Nocardia cyriacigeorgica]NEW37513.1 carbonic anhydrase family protein [Nocardia cyriacigeorgica]NEW44990.1 carbonic anhydrase family protein [Nocardia cyriacigeorgica]NEW56699.1 carbonic anhydrase family protein [Nocardia cyriacigeorgica]